MYKKLKEAAEIFKNQTKNHSVLAKTCKVYIICTPKCDALGNSFFPLLSIMECYKPNSRRTVEQPVLFSLPSIAQYVHRLCIVW